MLLDRLFARGSLCAALALLSLTFAAPASGWQMVRTGTVTPPAGLPGAGANAFGSRVALSADGSTLIVGEPGADRVIAFARTESGWTHEGTLQGPPGQDFGGSRLALTRDRSVAVIATGDGALVFTRTAGSWTQTAQLGAGTVTDVDVSGDGTRAVVGAKIFDRQGAGWTAGTTVTGLNLIGSGTFGGGAAISDDGQVVVMNGPPSVNGQGNLWTFLPGPGGTWPEMGGPLPEPTQSMALTPDGQTLINAGRVLERSGSSWTFRGDLRTLITGASYDLGGAVTISDDGKVMLAGGGSTQSGTWLFVREPDKAWQQPGPIANPDDARGGLSLTGDGSTAVIGNPEAADADGNDGVGEVVVLELRPGNPDDGRGGGGAGGGGGGAGGGGGGAEQPGPADPAPKPADSGPPSGQGGGSLAGGVTTGQVAKMLGPSAVRRNARTLIQRGFSFAVTAPAAGRLQIRWLAGPSGKSETVLASGQRTFANPGTAKVTMKLTRAGRTAVRRGKKLKVTVSGVFSPANGGTVVTASQKATMAR
ncbi:MAG: hypothetical protein JHC95_20895 [Solirubrobacteraceae bacterium]|nr:hypothetical protein [Solirubrobacteraceae bacterium]